MRMQDLPRDIAQMMCHASPLAWANYAMGSYVVPYDHLKYVESKLVRVGEDIKRLRISQPPQSGKSLLVSTSFPTWYLGRNPDARLMIVSYGGKRAHDLGQQTKDMFANHAGPIFGLECDPSARSKEFWKVKGHRGYLLSAGIGGPVNGFPADLIIFDDPYASAEDALSPAGRKTVERFVTSVLAARLQRGGSMLFVSTRWSADDIIGWSQKQERSGGDPWHEVVLQALPEVDRYDSETGQLIQLADQSICEELKPKEFLLEMKAACTYYEWCSLWQQTPVAAEGSLWEASMFGADQFTDDWPHDLDALVVAIDPAMGSDLADGDYSAIVALGIRGDGLFYTEADIEITGPEDTITRLIGFIDRLPRYPDLIGIESVGFAKLVKDIGAARLVENNIMVPVVALKPTMKHVSTGKDVTIRKQDRISMVLDTFIREQLMRYIRSRGTTRLVHQLENFPMKKYHDDGPDALEMCFRLLRDVGQTQKELSRIAAR